MTALIERILAVRVGVESYPQIIPIFICIFLLSWPSIDSYSADNNPSLKFLISGKAVDELTLDNMKSKLKSYSIERYDIEYKKDKRYEGFKLEDVLRLAYGDKLNSPDFTYSIHGPRWLREHSCYL